VDRITYQRLGDECYYAQELFDQEELTGYIRNMLTGTNKSVFEPRRDCRRLPLLRVRSHHDETERQYLFT